MPSLNRRFPRASAAAVALAACTAFTTPEPAVAVRSAPLAPGLYQSAYSERNDTLWATSSVGQPPAPVTDSRLLRLDPGTLEVEASHPAVVGADGGGVESVYGIDVDDERDTVWVTNTRDDSIAVYSQRTGRHLATVPGVAHAREIVVDEKRDTVWATAFGSGSVVAFDTRTYKEIRRVTVEGAGPTGLAVHERSGAVYATDFTHDRVIAIAPGAAEPRLLPAGDGPLSIALSPNGRTAYTADQGSGGVSVVDLRKGAVVRSTATGAGAKSLAAVGRSGRVLVANRLDGTVSLVDTRTGTVEEAIDTNALPNHVHMSDANTAYVLDKSAAGPEGQDHVTRIDVGPLTRRGARSSCQRPPASMRSTASLASFRPAPVASR
ncbi:YncE family protein [Streptomyces sp. NPDC006422]|uniref:YncE family protein n=1 Tax=unclassified Streptomyces TaxID=2593676 RepID=UPI0033A08DBC